MNATMWENVMECDNVKDRADLAILWTFYSRLKTYDYCRTG